MEVQQTAAKKTNAVYIYIHIYIYVCMYVCIYIGETSQYQQCRDRGHKDAIKACPNHEINWDDVSYLDKDNNTEEGV